MENSNADDETYWRGEEFRKGTPLFPRDLYNNFPDLLNDCISLEDSFKPLSLPRFIARTLISSVPFCSFIKES